MSDLRRVTLDFIFGTLATDELRLEALREAGRGFTHAGRIAPADPEPGQSVRLTVSAGTEVDAAAIFAAYTADGGDPGPDAPRVALAPGEAIWDTLLWGYRREWHGPLPAQADGTLVRYRIAAQTHGGSLVWADADSETGAPTTFAYHVDRERVPGWIRDAVIYHVSVDRFAPGGRRSWHSTTDLTAF